MICPKCLTLESEGSLRCRKCGAQLYTGVFQKVAVPPQQEPAARGARPGSSARTNLIALAVFVVAVLVLLLVMSRLEMMVR